MAVAAPIFGEHEVAIAAIGVVLPEREAQPRRLGYAVRTAAQSISRQLGGRARSTRAPPCSRPRPVSPGGKRGPPGLGRRRRGAFR